MITGPYYYILLYIYYYYLLLNNYLQTNNFTTKTLTPILNGTGTVGKNPHTPLNRGEKRGICFLTILCTDFYFFLKFSQVEESDVFFSSTPPSHSIGLFFTLQLCRMNHAALFSIFILTYLCINN